MILLKKDTAQRIGVRLLDGSGVAVTGVASGSVTATVFKSDGNTAAVTISGSVTWTEVTTGAFSGKGYYVLNLTAGFFDQAGEFVLAVNGGTGSQLVTGWVSPVEADVLTRLATSGYTAPDNTSVAAIKAKTDNLPADPASNTQVATRLAASAYTAPDNASVTAIKAKTDNLPPIPASQGDVTAARDHVEAHVDVNLDAKVSTRATPADVQVTVEPTPVTVDGGFTGADRIALANLDAPVSTRATPANIAALVPPGTPYGSGDNGTPAAPVGGGSNNAPATPEVG